MSFANEHEYIHIIMQTYRRKKNIFGYALYMHTILSEIA